MFYYFINAKKIILPVSPHASFLLIGGMIVHFLVWEKLWTVLSCGAVIGCDHIKVFIAGANNSGVSSQSQARTTEV